MMKGMKEEKQEKEEEEEKKEEELGARGKWSHKLYNWEQLAAS